jgi:hypothetical protein
MDNKRLSQLNYLNREIEIIIDKIEKLNDKKGKFKKIIGDDKEIETEILYLTDLLKCMQKKCFLEQRRIENFISTISDSQMRIIVSLRYINGFSWQQVAYEIGEFDESYPRKKYKKFLSELKRRAS